jgi:dephospho-CoA kinase
MILGITGGIGSGKSMVANCFARLGAAVVSADALAREVVLPGSPVLQQLIKRFGTEIIDPDGALDRRALAAVIFSDPEARRDLNRIIHPAIGALAERRLRQFDAASPLVVYEAPLLFEAGAEGRVDAVLVVRIEPQQQLQRLMTRDGLNETEARNRIEAQMPQVEKLARADYVIDNSGTPEETEAQVMDLFPRLSRGRVPPDHR